MGTFIKNGQMVAAFAKIAKHSNWKIKRW